MPNFNNKMDKFVRLSFLCIFLFILGSISCYYFFGNNQKNKLENRLAYQIPIWNLEDFKSGEYQKQFEKALSDQLIFYDKFKLFHNNFSFLLNMNTIKLFDNGNSHYLKLNNNVFLYQDYLVFSKVSNDLFTTVVSDDIEVINNLNLHTSANVYMYFIETDSIYDFENNVKIDVDGYLKEHLKLNVENIEIFDIKNFDNYKNYFYKVDHHWNYRGAYKAYLEIAEMMNFETILPIKDEICFREINNYGSKYRMLGVNSFLNEEVCKYIFDYPSYVIKKPKEIKNYERTIEYLQKLSFISYDDFYIGNFGEIIFENVNSKNNRKLLVYSNSFSGIINLLLASNYQETFVIDGRYIEDFDIKSYIEDKKIDDVLVLSNYMLFLDKKDW